MLLLTIEDLEGRRIWVRFGRRAARSKNLPFNVSRRCLSTALWVARRSAVLARRLGLRFIAFAALLLADELGPPCAVVVVAPGEDDVGDCVSLLLLLLLPEAEVELGEPPPALLLLLFPLLLVLAPFEVGDAGCVSEEGESGSVIAIYENSREKT